MRRRIVLQSLVSLPFTSQILTSYPQLSIAFAAASGETNTNTNSVQPQPQQPNLDCLADLPPIPTNCVRLYLCRHGQTEYNRLKKIQGSRIDAPLNDTGRKQATRMGKALSHAPNTMTMMMMYQQQSQQSQQSHLLQQIAAHSNLLRARETADIATTTLEAMIHKSNDSAFLGSSGSDKDNNDETTIKFINDTIEKRNNHILQTRTTKNNHNDHPLIKLQSLSTLGEVDFGPLNEGKSSTIAKAEMLKTYASWSLGDIDSTLGGSGESGRDVLTRAASALSSLTQIALENGSATTAAVGGEGGSSHINSTSSVIAVSHSTYLRMMLALVLDIPLSQAATMEQKNCCINVLDVSLVETKEVNSKSNLFAGVGGMNPIVPQDFQLTIPRVDVVRMNEKQHLIGLD